MAVVQERPNATWSGRRAWPAESAPPPISPSRDGSDLLPLGLHEVPVNLPEDDPDVYSHTRLILEVLELMEHQKRPAGGRGVAKEKASGSSTGLSRDADVECRALRSWLAARLEPSGVGDFSVHYGGSQVEGEKR